MLFLFFRVHDSSLRHTDIDLIFKYLTASCKPTVSEYLSNIVLINDSQLRGYPQ